MDSLCVAKNTQSPPLSIASARTAAGGAPVVNVTVLVSLQDGEAPPVPPAVLDDDDNEEEEKDDEEAKASRLVELRKDEVVPLVSHALHNDTVILLVIGFRQA